MDNHGNQAEDDERQNNVVADDPGKQRSAVMADGGDKCNQDNIETSSTEKSSSPAATTESSTPTKDDNQVLPVCDSKNGLIDKADEEMTTKVDNNNSVCALDSGDDGDPIPSGTGSVSKDCSASELLGWSEILPKWHSRLQQRPKGLNNLVRNNGIPEPLRGEVWQLLSGAHESSELMDQYRIFLTKTAPTEQIILRDVHRTYPAHENFRSDSQSSLTDSLFKVCKAYAVYDEEVGYCQGLSFLVAALLLHMPEEQAFCVFARIMQHYGLRDLFRNNFDELYLKFYQLEHMLEEHMPDLHQHFVRIGIEPFTYASQWFLTLFTAKFPLNAVFYIMDIFLLDGMNTIFQVALALLKLSKMELLALDFEGVLRFFRVYMPKIYRNQEQVDYLIQLSSQISIKKLKKYAKNYESKQQKEKLSQKQNPLTYIQLRAQFEILEDKLENMNRECKTHLHTISDMEDEKARLEVEVTQLKEVFRRELSRAETELARDNSIVSDYKKICSKLSRRLERQTKMVDDFVATIRDSLNDNEKCQDKSCLNLFNSRTEEFYKQLEQEDDDQAKNSSPKQVQQPPRRTSSGERSIGAYINDSNSTSSNEAKMKHLTEHINNLEIELAKTKLALVEAECKCQQLTHDLSVGATIEASNQTTSASSATGVLAGKLDFVKAAVTARRPASVAFAKINNLISEKISSPTVTTTNPTTATITNDKC